MGCSRSLAQAARAAGEGDSVMNAVAQEHYPDGSTRRGLRLTRRTPVVCPVCGSSFQRRAQKQIFCSTRCRERGKDRSRKTAVQPIKIEPHYPQRRATEPPSKTQWFQWPASAKTRVEGG